MNLNDAYQMWKQNEVTQMFMSELREHLRELESQRFEGPTLDAIGLNEVKRSGMIREVKRALEWEPKDLIQANEGANEQR